MNIPGFMPAKLEQTVPYDAMLTLRKSSVMSNVHAFIRAFWLDLHSKIDLHKINRVIRGLQIYDDSKKDSQMRQNSSWSCWSDAIWLKGWQCTFLSKCGFVFHANYIIISSALSV